MVLRGHLRKIFSTCELIEFLIARGDKNIQRRAHTLISISRSLAVARIVKRLILPSVL